MEYNAVEWRQFVLLVPVALVLAFMFWPRRA